MYDHIGLTVNDVAASARFYQSALAGLGYALISRDNSGAGFGPNGAAAFWLMPANDRPVPAYTSRFKLRIGPRSIAFMPRGCKPAGVITVAQACAPITAPATTQPF